MLNRMYYDLESRRKLKGGRKEFCAALDKALECCDPSAEVFVKIDKWKNDASGHLLLHLAVVTRTWTAAQDIRIKHAGWISLGRVVEPTSAIVERLKCEWNDPWSNCMYVLVHEELAGLVRSVCKIIAFDVSAPAPIWLLVDSFKEEITEQAQDDWETLAADDDCVHFACLQVLPDRIE